MLQNLLWRWPVAAVVLWVICATKCGGAAHASNAANPAVLSQNAQRQGEQKPGNFGRLKDWQPNDPKPSTSPPQKRVNLPATPRRRRGGRGGGGSAGFERRLQAAGAKTGDVQISLAWNTTDDVDLYVDFAPGNGVNGMDSISYRNRIGRLSGGMLDVDMNAGGRWSNTPVENVFWPPGSSPQGMFKVGAHLYSSRTRLRTVPIVIRIKRGQHVETIQSSVSMGQGVKVIRTFQHPEPPGRQENTGPPLPVETPPPKPPRPDRESQKPPKQNPFQPN